MFVSAPFNHRRRAGRHAARGFTLLEIIVVVTIIALLATLIAPRLLGNVDKAKVSKAKAGVANIASQVSIYILDSGGTRVPDDFDLNVLAEGDKPVLKKSDLIDPWGAPYVIISPGDVNIGDFDVVSYGADNQPGGEGFDADITN